MCKNSSSNSFYLRLNQQDKCVDLGEMNRCPFLKLENLSDLSFFVSQNTPIFELRFYRLVDLNIIYIWNFRFVF
jgi:hypothetical protein